jgi:hypothetical protein
MSAAPLNGELTTDLPRPRGRPVGSQNKSTIAKLAIERWGFAPLEAMMESTAHFLEKARNAKELAQKPNLDPEMKIRANALADESYLQVSECASKAAVYCHPKLAIVKLPGEDGGPPFRVESLNREQLATLIARIRAGHHLPDPDADGHTGGDGEDGPLPPR